MLNWDIYETLFGECEKAISRQTAPLMTAEMARLDTNPSFGCIVLGGAGYQSLGTKDPLRGTPIDCVFLFATILEVAPFEVGLRNPVLWCIWASLAISSPWPVRFLQGVHQKTGHLPW